MSFLSTHPISDQTTFGSGDAAGAGGSRIPKFASQIQAAGRPLRVIVYLGCSSLLLALIAFNFADIDLWHQMNLIRASLVAGHLLTQDPFAYTATLHPMIDHEWGAGVLAFFLGKWLGGYGILLLKFGSAFATLLVAMRLAERSRAGATVLGFLAPLGIGLLFFGFLSAIRAQAYSLLFTAALLWALETARRPSFHNADRRKNQRWLWAFLAVFPIWVNLHAGFVVGVGFVFLYCIEQALLRKPLAPAIIILAAMTLEIFLTPYGARYFSYLARALTMARPRIPEWSPLWTLGWSPTLLFIAAVSLLVYALEALKTWRTPGMLLLTSSAAEAIVHRKLLPFFALAWLCYVPAYVQNTPLGQWLEQFAGRRRRFVVLAWTALIVICLAAAIRQKFWKLEVPQITGDPSYPVGAVGYLAAHQFRGNIMVPFRVGAYVSWMLYPGAKVSIDSRYEVAYPNDWVERVFRFYDAREGWRETLNAYPTDLVLAPRSAPVLRWLHELSWKPVYVDSQFELAARPGLQLPAVDRSAQSFAGSFP